MTERACSRATAASGSDINIHRPLIESNSGAFVATLPCYTPEHIQRFQASRPSAALVSQPPSSRRLASNSSFIKFLFILHYDNQCRESDISGLEVFGSLTEAQLRNRLEPNKGLFIAESPQSDKGGARLRLHPTAMLCEGRHIEGDASDIIARCPDMTVCTQARASCWHRSRDTNSPAACCAPCAARHHVLWQKCSPTHAAWL